MTEKLTISVDELAEMLGVSRPVAYQLAHKSGFPAIKVSDRRIVIPLDSLRSWLDAQTKA